MHFPCWMAYVRLVTIVEHAYILFLYVQLYTSLNVCHFYKAYFEQHIDYVIEYPVLEKAPERVTTRYHFN